MEELPIERVAELRLDYIKRLREQVAELGEENSRLREQFKLAYDWVDTQFPDGGMADFAKYIGDLHPPELMD